MSCTATNGDSLLSLKTHIAGMECEGWFLYAAVIVFTVILQIVRNRIWAVSGQAGREALHTSKGSSERWYYIRWLLIYTFLSTTLHIVNILLILGSNLGILLAVLVGNLSGTLYAYVIQPADKHRTSEDISSMLKKYKELKKHIRHYDEGRRKKPSNEEYEMLRKIEETKELLLEFLDQNVEEVDAYYMDEPPKPLNFRIRR